MRFPILFSLLLAGAMAAAQPETSLTPEFAGLSAKERARLAKKEQEDALQDARFQGLMNRAETEFQEQRFEEALATYQEARALRPLNVYPKVKIQDLQALIAKRKAEQAGMPEAITLTEAKAEERPPSEAVPPLAPEVPVVRTEEPRSQPASAPVAPKPKVSATVPPQERPSQATPAEPLPDGIQERSFLEGRAVVQERSITRSGVTTVYRKVTHPWGQVVHFRDGAAISEREWAEALAAP